jgi:hypothetical protein
VLALALDDEARDDERKVAYLNVADACERESDKPRSHHDLRLTHEVLVRHAQEDPTREEPLDRFLAKHPEFTDTRAALLVANQTSARHDRDTRPSARLQRALYGGGAY